MGLFDSIKKSKEVNKKSEWKIGLNPVVVELNEDHLLLYNSVINDIVFYRDIRGVEVSPLVVTIKTNVKSYQLRSRSVRGGTDKARELQMQLMEKMSEYKN